MATNPPVDEQTKTATSAEMEALYVQHNFDEILSYCETHVVENRHYPAGHPFNPLTIHKHGAKYRLNGTTVAVIFHYTHANKTITRHIRMLRVAGIRYSAPDLPPVHPLKR
jgi:hypothetical protein